MKTDAKNYGATGPTPTKAPDAEAAAHGPSGNQAASWNRAAAVESSDLFIFKQCQDLFRTRLTEPLVRLIPQLTGVRLHVLWHGPVDFHEPGEMPVLCPWARQQMGAKGTWPKCCESRLKPILFPGSQCRRFIGPCGTTNFYACLQVGKVCPLTLVLQAAVTPRSPSSHRVNQMGNTRFWAEHAGEPVSPAAFRHAMALARLIVDDLESAAQARMARSGQENALRRLDNTEAEATRLRAELRHRLPALPEPTLQPSVPSHLILDNNPSPPWGRGWAAAGVFSSRGGPGEGVPPNVPVGSNNVGQKSSKGGRAQKRVEAMLEHVRQHYHCPINLGDVASTMKMNASYLSALFSQTTGVTFHHFLEEVRLSKAKEMLRDPRSRVAEVARAAGYASLDAFRHAFKAHEGLSPEAWRAGQ